MELGRQRLNISYARQQVLEAKQNNWSDVQPDNCVAAGQIISRSAENLDPKEFKKKLNYQAAELMLSHMVTILPPTPLALDATLSLLSKLDGDLIEAMVGINYAGNW